MDDNIEITVTFVRDIPKVMGKSRSVREPVQELFDKLKIIENETDFNITQVNAF